MISIARPMYAAATYTTTLSYPLINQLRLPKYVHKKPDSCINGERGLITEEDCMEEC